MTVVYACDECKVESITVKKEVMFWKKKETNILCIVIGQLLKDICFWGTISLRCNGVESIL